MTITLTSTPQQQMIQFLMSARLEDVPEAVLEDARRSLSDSLACQVAGVTAPLVQSIVEGQAAGRSPVLGVSKRTGPTASALLGGMAATWHDLDSGHRHPSVDPPVPAGHTPVHTIPTLLALGEPLGMSGEDFFRAYLVTYEFGARIAVASSLRSGLHPHGVHATTAAGAAAALATNCDEALLDRTIRIAAGLNIIPSVRSALDGGTVRNSFAGLGAMNGVLAERLARAGVEPESDPLSTMYRDVVASGFDGEDMNAGLGEDWETTLGYYKVHACCRWNHPALDALEDIVNRHKLTSTEIESIEIRTFAFAAQMFDDDPATDLGAKFSLPWSTAAYLILGSTGPVGYTPEALADQRIRDLARKVKVVEEPAYSAQLPSKRPTTTLIRLRDGTVAASSVLGSLGDPHNRFEPGRMEAKYFELVSSIVGDQAARRSKEMLDSIESLNDIGTLVAELTGNQSR